MAGSIFQASIVPLGLVEAPGGAAPGAGRSLAFVVQHQNQTNWCWAAVTASIAAYYRNQGWPQCRVVNDRLGQAVCCQDGSSTICNQPWYLDQALKRVGNLANYVASPLAMSQIRNEVDAGRPIGVRIGWMNGGGHFITVRGYSDQGLVDVQDPWFGGSTLDYISFKSRYHGFGKWTHSYMSARGSN
jgi:Papain-like cysteine protease AvrRpt2